MQNKSKEIINALSSQIDPSLAGALIAEFIDLEKTFFLEKWKYSQLDGGRFCEVVARILYSIDSGNINLNKPVDDCLQYVENNKVKHAFPEQRSAIHIAKILRATYKLRSQRGAVHVAPDYSADESDSKLVVENCRWLMIEILRLFWGKDKKAVIEVMREITRFQIPIIRDYEGRILVQRTDFTVEEEILLLLYRAGNVGMKNLELLNNIPKDPSGTRKALKRLLSSKRREAIEIGGIYKITDLGIQRTEHFLFKEQVLNKQ